MHFDPIRYLMSALVFIVSITFHEFGHAIAADRLGDNTPRSEGRISVNPVDHIDPIGLIFFLVSQYTEIGLGWGKPVMTRPENYKHPRRDAILVAAAGPFTNLIQAVIFAGIIQANDRLHFYTLRTSMDALMQIGVSMNVGLMFFNMIPVPPLDGSKVLSGLLPNSQARAYDRFMGTFGLIIFILLIVTPVLQFIIGPETSAFFHFLADQR